MKYPHPIVLKILSMEAFAGNVQLKMLKCRFRRCGMSFLPPPGCIIAPINYTQHFRLAIASYQILSFNRHTINSFKMLMHFSNNLKVP